VTLTRAVRFLVRNWPLKLAAVALATMLYAGLVVSQNTQVFEDASLPIRATGQAEDIIVLTNLGVVDRIRYFAPPGIRIDREVFEATVDLTDIDPQAGGSVSLDVRVRSIDPRVNVVDWEPARVIVGLDRFVEKEVPVAVELLDVEAGLDVREPEVSAEIVTVRGPESVVTLVARVLAYVQIDPSGLDFDRDVDVIPVNALGETLSPIDAEPRSVRVRVAVFTDRQTKSMPVNPIVTGTPAAGFEVERVIVEPVVVSVEGDVDQLAPLARADTAPIVVTGATSDVRAVVELALPTGVLPLGEPTVSVTVTLRPVTATRSFSAGLVLVGARGDRTYDLASDRVTLTIGGPVADLDRLQAATLTATVDVSAIDDGTRLLDVTADVPAGLALVAVSPASVVVTVIPPPSPTPTAAGSPATSTPAPTPTPPPHPLPNP
jgi:YbbR domain-containing protein